MSEADKAIQVAAPRYSTLLYSVAYHTISPYHTYQTVPYHTISYQIIPYHAIPCHTRPYDTMAYHPYHTMLDTMYDIYIYTHILTIIISADSQEFPAASSDCRLLSTRKQQSASRKLAGTEEDFGPFN